MLYDPKWQSKTDIFTVPAFIAWLQTQPPNRNYNWSDLRETTGEPRPVSRYWNGHPGFGGHTLGTDWGYFEICSERPWTFGAATERAKAHYLKARHHTE
jgi:hypothetical protein